MSEKEAQELKVLDRRHLPVSEEKPNDMVIVAMQKGYDPALIEKMMALQERYEANEARKQYHAAMSRFKAHPPEIMKDKHVSFGEGKASYDHASLANVTQKINEGLSKEELSAAWSTKQENGTISVTCRITHSMGHSEETTLSAAPDTSGNKNSIQAIGSTISYLQRYTLLSLTGLATFDQDDDGNSAGRVDEPINDEQLSRIKDMIDSIDAAPGVIEKGFLKHMGIEKIGDLKQSEFNRGMRALEATKKEREKG